MTLAQRLYESRLYHFICRTDSTHLSDDALASAVNYIGVAVWYEYLQISPLRYSAREGHQEAHETIRPTDVKNIATKT